MLKRIDVPLDDDNLSFEEDLDSNITLPSVDELRLDTHEGDSDGIALYYEAVSGGSEDREDAVDDLDLDFADDETEEVQIDNSEQCDIPEHIEANEEKEEAGYDGDEVRAYIKSLESRLLTKQEEQELAFVKLHADHDRRLLAFSNDYIARACLKPLVELSKRESREDRVLDVSVNNKKQRAIALDIVDLHVPTIEKLLNANKELVKTVMNRHASPEERKECLTELHRNRRKVAILLHESKLRSKYVDSAIKKLRKFSERLDSARGSVPSPNEEIPYHRGVLILGESPRTVQKRLERIEEVTEIREKAKKPLIDLNRRFAMSVAKQYRSRGIPFIDLIGEANTGLIRGVEKFDPRLDFKLSTYANNWIHQALKKAVQEKSRVVKVTITGIKEIQKFREMKKELSEKLGREPNSEEVRARFHEVFKSAKNKQKAADLFAWVSANSNSMGALDAVVGADEGQTLGKFIERDYRRIEPIAAAEECRKQERISDALEILDALRREDPRGAHVVELRLGLFGSPVHTLKEIGVALGVTRERIRQIESNFLTNAKNIALQRAREEDGDEREEE